ncbi:MAG TPA: hypothetical protein VEI48_11880 [Candidatus Sulfotelmatobacter sp.]|nr:hypothetical protein [Candidatus Sulfotelmatobacter sp.]
MVIEDRSIELELEPGWVAVAEPLDAESTQALSRRFSDATPGRIAVQVAPTDTYDVSGHAAGGATVDVVLTIGDDVEGHAFSLRFPTPQDAQRMRTRLAAGGLLVAALTVASIGVGNQLAAPHTATGAAVQAAPAAAAPFVNRGLNADIRSGDIVVEEAAPPAPFVNRGLNADIRSGDIVQEESGTTPAVHGEQKN